MLSRDLVLGSVTGTYYSLFQNVISKTPTLTPSLINQNHIITRHDVSVTKYKIVIKHGPDWSPASSVVGEGYFLGSVTKFDGRLRFMDI